MKVGNNSIKTLCVYNKDYTLEPGDLVISPNGILFYVRLECQGINPDTDKENYYEPYSNAQAATSIEELENDTTGKLLVPADLLVQYITQLVIGLSLEGSIDVMSYDTTELMLMSDNQVHLLTGVSGSIETADGDIQLSSNNLLVRVYKATDENNEEVIIQELVDYTKGFFYYRSKKGSGIDWTPFKYVGSDAESASLFQDQFGKYQNLINRVLENIRIIQNDINNYYSFYEAVNGNNKQSSIITVTDKFAIFSREYLEVGSICIAFVSYKFKNDGQNSPTYQESKYIDPFTNGVLHTQYYDIEVSGTYSKTVEFKPSAIIDETSFKISRVIISKRSNLI